MYCYSGSLLNIWAGVRPTTGGFTCVTCGRTCASRIGLLSHRRTHPWRDPSYRRLSPSIIIIKHMKSKKIEWLRHLATSRSVCSCINSTSTLLHLSASKSTSSKDSSCAWHFSSSIRITCNQYIQYNICKRTLRSSCFFESLPASIQTAFSRPGH